MSTIQHTELLKAIKTIGSVRKFSKLLGKQRSQIYKMLEKAETLDSRKDLCKVDLAIEMEMICDKGISWRLLCPKTACSMARLTWKNVGLTH